jgi:hypothetical protein
MQKLPADSGSTLTPVSGNPMANNAYSGEFLKVEVEQIPRRLMLIALDGCGRLKRLETI